MKITILVSILISVASSVGSKSAQNYIVNGNKAVQGQFPHQATLLIRRSYWGGYKYTPICGATIISNQWLVTAGHCSLGFNLPYDVDKLRVIIGVHRLNHEDRIFGAVERFIPHPKFTMVPRIANDIGLIKLKEPINFDATSYVAPAKLPSKTAVFTGIAQASGHGLIDPRYQDSVSEHLLWIDVKIIEDRACANFPFYRTGQAKFDSRMMICAIANPGSSPCNGDSGGPLVQKSGNDFTLVGVVSLGPKNCGMKGVPFIFTKVSNYIDWIYGVMAGV